MYEVLLFNLALLLILPNFLFLLLLLIFYVFSFTPDSLTNFFAVIFEPRIPQLIIIRCGEIFIFNIFYFWIKISFFD